MAYIDVNGDWNPLGGGIALTYGGITALTIHNNDLFTGQGNIGQEDIAAKISKWNSTNWTSLSSTLGETGTLVYCNGYLYHGTSGDNRVGFEKRLLGGSSWTTITPSAYVTLEFHAALCYKKTLYVGGKFYNNLASGMSVATWNKGGNNKWEPVGNGIKPYSNNTKAHALLVAPSMKIKKIL